MSLSVQNSEQSQVSALKNVSSTASSSFKEALDAFYEIHQRSQITGVSTYVYNKALDSIGIDSSQTFSAVEGINLLQTYGYNTNRPTDEAILKYGALDQEHGNKSYMQNGRSASSEALKEEIEVLNEETDNAYAGAQNYYDIALKNSNVDSQEFSTVQAEESFSTTLLSTDETLRNLFKREMITLLKNDENFLRDILKELF